MGIQTELMLSKQRSSENRKLVAITLNILIAEEKTIDQLQRMINNNNDYMRREFAKGFSAFRGIKIANEAAELRIEQLLNNN